MCTNADTTTSNLPNPQNILSLINQVAADESTRKQVSVLPIMCGSGKSTAISMKIRQTIEELDENGNGDGLIIVTDSVRGMHSYMEPNHCPDLLNFLSDNADKVTILEYNDLEGTRITMQHTPVLIMSTQRLFQYSTEEQITQYLKWNDTCKRTLILIDEEAMYNRVLHIDRRVLNDIDTALHKTRSAATKENAVADFNWVIDFWENQLKGKLTAYMDSFEQEADVNNGNQFGGISSLHFYNARCDVIELDNILRFSKFVDKYRNIINQFDNNPHALTDCIRAVCHIRQFGSLYEFISNAGIVFLNSFVTVSEKRSPLFKTYLTAKTIVLDGTAHPEQPEYATLNADFRDCSEFNRDLSNLTIKIFDGGYGKSSFNIGRRLAVKTAQKISSIINSDAIDRNQCALFTYGDEVETAFKRQLNGVKVNHFGAIHGTNEFNQCTAIFQVGMNVYQESDYFAYQIAEDVPLAMFDLPDQNTDIAELLRSISKKSDSRMNVIKDRLLLTELEQNIMRGIIRNNPCTVPYTFYLFTSVHYHESVIEKLKAKFANPPFNAHIEIVPESTEEKEERTRARKAKEGSRKTKPQLFYELHDSLSAGDTYNNHTIAEKCGIKDPKDVRATFRTNKDILAILDTEKTSNAKYKKM